MLRTAFSQESLPDSVKEAIIIIIPKPGKDAQYPESYRHISLLNAVMKILALELANRLTKYISKLILRDQSGFIPARSTATNIRRLFLNTQLSSENLGGRAVLTLDVTKAFDSVQWLFIWKTIRAFGIGLFFIKWIQLLYSSPKARKIINRALASIEAQGRDVRCVHCCLLWQWGL